MSEESTTSSEANGESSSSGYTEIARKWSRVGTNLLASGLVIVVAIALVRYVAPWWKQEQVPSSNANLEKTVGQGMATDDPHGVLSGFGELANSLREAKLVGDREQATSRLRQLCRQSVKSLDETNRKVGPAELRILQSLGGYSPVDVETNRWRMYVLDGPAPIVAVVAWNAANSANANRDSQDLSPGVLSWGIAVPAANSQWTLFVYPGSGDRFSTIPMFSQLELPAGTARTMSLNSENGSAMTAFTGSVSVAACRRQFDQWSVKSNVPQIAPWRKLGKQWLARFGDGEVGWLDVHLFEDNERLTGGFLSISSPEGTVDNL